MEPSSERKSYWSRASTTQNSLDGRGLGRGALSDKQTPCSKEQRPYSPGRPPVQSDDASTVGGPDAVIEDGRSKMAAGRQSQIPTRRRLPGVKASPR